MLVLEKEKRTGGQIHTHYPPGEKELRVEAGAHTCYNSYTHLISVINDINYTEAMLPLAGHKYLIYDEGKIKSPFAVVSFPQMVFNGWRCFFLSMKGKTVREHFSRIVGKGNYNKLFTYMFRAVISQEADDYPADIFLKRRKERRKELPRKFSFKKGLSSFIDEIIRTDKLDIRTGAEVTDIEYKDGLFAVLTSQGDTFFATGIAIATHTASAAVLTRKIDSEVSRILGDIAVSDSETLTLTVERDKTKVSDVAGIIPTSDEFNSVVSNDVAAQPGARGFSFHFPKGAKSNEEKLATACEVLGIGREEIIEYSFTTHVLPAIRMKDLGMIGTFDRLSGNRHVFLLGNYFYGLSLEDCVQRSTEEAERYLASAKERERQPQG